MSEHFTFRREWSCPRCDDKNVVHITARPYQERIEHCDTCQAMAVLITQVEPTITVLRVEEEVLVPPTPKDPS